MGELHYHTVLDNTKKARTGAVNPTIDSLQNSSNNACRRAVRRCDVGYKHEQHIFRYINMYAASSII